LPMSQELPKAIHENLSPGESIVVSVSNFGLSLHPQYIVLTDRRVIYFSDEMFGRYHLRDIQYTRLKAMRAETGRITFGAVGFEGDDEESFSLAQVPRDIVQPFVDSFESTMNGVLIEPVSVERGRGLMGRMTWEFRRPAKARFRKRGEARAREEAPQPQPVVEDPLVKLQMRFVNGEITEEEYLSMRRLLVE
jgi:hypothetical protein